MYVLLDTHLRPDVQLIFDRGQGWSQKCSQVRPNPLKLRRGLFTDIAATLQCWTSLRSCGVFRQVHRSRNKIFSIEGVALKVQLQVRNSDQLRQRSTKLVLVHVSFEGALGNSPVRLARLVEKL